MGYVPYGSGQPTTPPYAGFWQRVAGYLLDGLLYGLIGAIFYVPAIIIGLNAVDGCDWVETRDNEWDLRCPPGEANGGLIALAILLAVIGSIVVAVLYLRALGRTGQTWGRQIVGIKVVRKDQPDQPLGIGKAFLRTLVAGLVSGNCILGYLWMLWDKDKQTWHDKIINTVVVRV